MSTVWVNGCFDILHPGHIELFKIAKSLGDQLIVGVDTDEKIRADKGAFRPINNLHFRKTMLESIRYIDMVVTFGSNEELSDLIAMYSPDILLVGSDWKNRKVVGGTYAKKVCFLNRVGSYSTSDIVWKIKNDFK